MHNPRHLGSSVLVSSLLYLSLLISGLPGCSSDGEVKNIVVAKALGYGLTTRAIRAARQIKFQPALKDDRPVSMYIQLE